MCIPFAKKSLSALVFSALALCAAASVSAENLDFALVNKTGYVINEVYVSSAATNDWEEDVLGRDSFGNGDRVNIHFDRGSSGCNWDMKVVYEDEEEAVWERLDLCEISSVTLRYDRNKGSTWAETQ